MPALSVIVSTVPRPQLLGTVVNILEAVHDYTKASLV